MTAIPIDKAAVLRARAAKAAQAVQTTTAPKESVEIVEFLLGSESFAIRREYVRDVHSLRNLTPLPCVPIHIAGIINIRGQIHAVIDMPRLFELECERTPEKRKVVLVSVNGAEAGFIADEVVGMRSVSPNSIETSLPTITGLRADFLDGIAEGRVIILDVAKILSDPRIQVNEDVGA